MQRIVAAKGVSSPKHGVPPTAPSVIDNVKLIRDLDLSKKLPAKGYVRDLEISGTGYRATLAGKKLQLALGFSHPIEIDPPAGISFALETPQKVRVAGAD